MLKVAKINKLVDVPIFKDLFTMSQIKMHALFEMKISLELSIKQESYIVLQF